MPRTYSAVIADASCFILLDKIRELSILQSLFKTITTSSEIANEFEKPLPEWVQIKTVQDKNFLSALFVQLDAGEAGAIAIAAENQPSLLIIDDLKGRKLAQKLNLTITGTLGLILTAKKEGIVSRVKHIFDKIQVTNFRIAPCPIGKNSKIGRRISPLTLNQRVHRSAPLVNAWWLTTNQFACFYDCFRLATKGATQWPKFRGILLHL